MRTLAGMAFVGMALVAAGEARSGAGTAGVAASSDNSLSKLAATQVSDKAAQNSSASASDAGVAVPSAVRGKKLVLKNGSFQLVRSYERQGEKVRYLSAERGDWEEIPAAMVDWDATAKAAAVDEAAEKILVQRVHQQQVESGAEVPMDVDASLRVGAGVFLPPGEGMFAVEGKTVTRLEQAGANTKLDKKRVVEQVISPIPIVPSKHNVVLAGAKAKVRIVPDHDPLEFFLREADIDPDTGSAIMRSGNAGEAIPDVELVRATVKGGKRQLESIHALFGQQLGVDRQVISLQRWDVAPAVYRFTLSESLEPGEYALAEILPDGINMFVWDFGVDGPAGAKDAR
jgi:hypothetical protein